MIYKIWIPGKHKAKQSTRFVGRAGSFAYPDKDVVDYQNWVKICFRQMYPGHIPLDGPIRAAVIYTRHWPKMSKKKRDTHHGYVIGRPDVEQVTKAIYDALNGIAWTDDSRIVRTDVVKIYSDSEGVLLYFGDDPCLDAMPSDKIEAIERVLEELWK